MLRRLLGLQKYLHQPRLFPNLLYHFSAHFCDTSHRPLFSPLSLPSPKPADFHYNGNRICGELTGIHWVFDQCCCLAAPQRWVDKEQKMLEWGGWESSMGVKGKKEAFFKACPTDFHSMPFQASARFHSCNSYWRMGHTHSPPVRKNKQTTKWAKKSTLLHSPLGVATQSPHTWQGSSHFFPRHPGAQVQVPSRVLQAPPLRHWHVKLQPKPQVPLGQLMEQSTPCQPVWQERQSVWGDKGGPGAWLSSSKPRLPLETSWRCLTVLPSPGRSSGRQFWLCHKRPPPEMKRNPQWSKQPTVPCDRSGMLRLRRTPGLLGRDGGVRSPLMGCGGWGRMISFVYFYGRK